MLIIELFEILSYMSVEEWLNKLQYIHTINSRYEFFFPSLKKVILCVPP